MSYNCIKWCAFNTVLKIYLYIFWQSQFSSSALLNNMVSSLLWSYLCCYVCLCGGFPLGSGWFQLLGLWVKVLRFTTLTGWRRRGVRWPLSPSDNNTVKLWTHTVNRVLTHGAFWSRLCLLWPLMFCYSLTHITPTLASLRPCPPIVFQP